MNEAVRNKDLIVIPASDALKVFTTEGAIDPILERIRREIDTFQPDMTTPAGRKEIAAMAYKVAQSKSRLEEIGKELADEQKKIPKKIDATRKRIRDKLDAWRDQVRAPLTEWEEAEKAKIDAIKADLAELQGVIDHIDRDYPSEVIRDRIAEIRAETITEERFGDCLHIALDLQSKAIAALEAKLVRTLKAEADAAELARLRVIAEEAIRKEAAEAAAQAERNAAAAEREASARRERELKQETEDAQRRADQAVERAKREAAEEAALLAEKQAKRAADSERRSVIHHEMIVAFIANGISEEAAREFIRLVAENAIPHLSINY